MRARTLIVAVTLLCATAPAHAQVGRRYLSEKRELVDPKTGVPAEIVYCHETGGDAPQRMWFVKGDGSGNKALYKETPDEWVTHEIVVEKDHVVFNIMAHQARLRTHPTGIALINIRTQQMKILGYAEGQGYWHSTATQDLKWAAGDNVTADCLDLINIKTGEKTTLITNLYQGKGIGNKTHSHHRFSPDGTRLLFSSAMLGSAHIFTVAIPPVARGDAKK